MGRGEWGTEERACSEPCPSPARRSDNLDSLLPRELEILGCRRRWHMTDGALTRGHWAAAAHSGDVCPRTHPTPHTICAHTGATHRI